ncbi:AhpC/TSA family protein [Sporolituus thermophilus DSM 23256]|uniref:AhpC/TSA family protein n=3 Tax=Sporolituus TaxID=909931 RepID=A0A1G7LI57_9FIRM|nr:AhpC/TSA family protein [Sporolituus thermophilus DSM 23256]
MMEDLQPGMVAPDFTLPSAGGNQVGLRDYAGRKLVLYFYPKDNTPG